MRLTTLGIRIGYGAETTIGEKPAAFTELGLVSSIGGISLEVEQIDVSALKDTITQYAKGRQDTGGNWEISFIADPDDSIPAIKTLFTASATAAASGKRIWYEVVIPNMTDAFFVVADCGDNIPLPELNQNEALTIPLSLVIQEYKGLSAKVALPDSSSS